MVQLTPMTTMALRGCLKGNTPDAVTKTFVVPFVWGSVVGVTGLICLIVGIVLLVKVNGKRRRIMQEAMMAAVR